MSWLSDYYDELERMGITPDYSYEELQTLGDAIYLDNDTEALQVLAELALDAGLGERAVSFYEYMDNSIYEYAALNEFKIDYDENVKRWRDVDTGRFVKDPYEYLRRGEW